MSAGYRRGQSAVETTLLEICTRFGLCLSPDHQAEMLEMPTNDLDAWTRAVFEKEGLDVPDKRMWKNVREHVERRLGIGAA